MTLLPPRCPGAGEAADRQSSNSWTKTGPCEAIAAPVILLEGTWQLQVEAHAPLEKLAATLFREFPQAIFRSGNAEGTETVFAKAIADLDPSRLQLVLPNSGIGRARRPAGVACSSLWLCVAWPQPRFIRLFPCQSN